MIPIICFFFSLGNVLDSCDSHVISNNNIYVDFGVIESQCSCFFSNALNAQLIYSLSRYPRYDCGTAIQIKEMNGVTYRMPCTSSVSTPVFSSLPTTVELVDIDPTYWENPKYCLRVLSNSRYHNSLNIVYLKSTNVYNTLTKYYQFNLVHSRCINFFYNFTYFTPRRCFSNS